MRPSYEAKLAADLYHAQRADDKELKRIEEEIRIAAAKGKYFIAVAAMSRPMWEALREAGYSVSHLSDGYEISWGMPDEMKGVGDGY